MAAAAGIGAIGSILGGITGGKGAAKAAKIQAKAYKAGLAQQQAQFDVTQKNVAPWIQGGGSALDAQLQLLGLGHGTPGTPGVAASSGATKEDQLNQLLSTIGPHSVSAYQRNLQRNPNATIDDKIALAMQQASPDQQAALSSWAAQHGPVTASDGTPGLTGAQQQQGSIDALKASPMFTSLYGIGNDTILQNAAATGGLRGGNTQNSLAQFSSSLLAQVIQNQLSNLGGISAQGANSAIGLGQLSQSNSNAQSQLQGQIGNANATAAAAPYATLQGLIGQLTGGGAAGLGNFFGGGSGSGVSAYGNAAINSMGSVPVIWN